MDDSAFVLAACSRSMEIREKLEADPASTGLAVVVVDAADLFREELDMVLGMLIESASLTSRATRRQWTIEWGWRCKQKYL